MNNMEELQYDDLENVSGGFRIGPDKKVSPSDRGCIDWSQFLHPEYHQSEIIKNPIPQRFCGNCCFFKDGMCKREIKLKQDAKFAYNGLF